MLLGASLQESSASASAGCTFARVCIAMACDSERRVLPVCAPQLPGLHDDLEIADHTVLSELGGRSPCPKWCVPGVGVTAPYPLLDPLCLATLNTGIPF
eukprot:318917-Chlamydomonas_euryale.AAC.1